MAALQYEISSGDFRASIRQKGAQISSLINQQNGHEYMWRADPQIWGSSAPVLFPIVGRLKNDSYVFEGQRYTMGGHGIARDQEFSLVGSDTSSVTLAFTSSEQTRLAWPFDFSLTIRFRLIGARLLIEHTVCNTGERAMPFALGAHPAFALNAQPGEFSPTDLAAYSIEFSRPETLDRYQLDGTVIGHRVHRQYLDGARSIVLDEHLFDHDALIFKNIASDMISLVHRQRGRLLSVDTGGAPHLGIWAKPAAPFVCIEPWHGYSDSVDATGHLIEKPSMKSLDAGYSFDWSYAISVY